ncbi:cell cycle checkpoint control protein RAD9A isoform X1 [Capsicum annuum]|uniref:cell cycle checkpoint control protein RAD9A isoform X1 n=1 Tax=Capsicum annuum TaxID=4072 RepID=UPI001FB086E1|nr:cell cycle checkpoint control protein RAD9A isoform X1 [Capsicum annuum]XP_047254065.1 cell cycle checkpoint control protein RAD9A isoform X1 [Capsicum annuum]
MEFTLSGNALKTFTRSITCLARIGNELAIQASSTKLTFHTLNSSRSAYLSITFKPGFFDVYTVFGPQMQCSVLLKAICSVLRTPIASIDHLTVLLPNPDASKVQWTLNCHNGMKKAYWITCDVEPHIQNLSLDRTKLPSNFVLRPRDLNRLFSNFQTTLQEITIIATNPTCLPPDAATEIGGKAVELRSYIDPTKENDSALHTQLWIDPTEEFVQYNHIGSPVDVTFGVKESKAFLSFCEGCEVDIQFYFDKAGEPILVVPKFGLDDGSNSTFDATLMLATMLMSQLYTASSSENPQVVGTSYGQANDGRQAPVQERSKGNSGLTSDQTRIWSDLSEQKVAMVLNMEEKEMRTIMSKGNFSKLVRCIYLKLEQLEEICLTFIMTFVVLTKILWNNLKAWYIWMVMLLNTILVTGWMQMMMMMKEMSQSCVFNQHLHIIRNTTAQVVL